MAAREKVFYVVDTLEYLYKVAELAERRVSVWQRPANKAHFDQEGQVELYEKVRT